jgi:polar amino acid transport system permease protein
MISLEELMWHGQSLAGLTMRSVEVFTIVALIYMALTWPQTLLVNWLHRRSVIGAR